MNFLLKYSIFNCLFVVLSIKLYYYINEHIIVGSEPVSKKNHKKSIFSGVVEESSFTFEELIDLNDKLKPTFQKIRESLFMKIFKVNLDNTCNFAKQNMICNFPTCGVCQCEENEIPLPWRQESEFDKIDKNIDDKFYQWVEKYNPEASNSWILPNEVNPKHGSIYVNLLKNMEAFTGYQGKHIWNAIYNENCFADELDSMCKEEQILYKIISGLHTNINIHLSQYSIDINKLDFQQESYQNLTMLHERVLHNDRLNNLFFLYGLLIKTTYKFQKTILNYNFTTHNTTDDSNLEENFHNLYSLLHQHNDSLLIQDDIEKKLTDYKNIDQIKSRFRNISQIIDCVSCQKCKLHGKLQISGLATMFKILFDKNKKDIIHRNEIISFVNLVIKVGRAIDYLVDMTNKIVFEGREDLIECSEYMKGRCKISNAYLKNTGLAGIDKQSLRYLIIFALICVFIIVNILYFREEFRKNNNVGYKVIKIDDKKKSD